MARGNQYPRPRCPRCRRDRRADHHHVYEYVVVSRTPVSALLECPLCHYQWRSRNAIVISTAPAGG